MTTEKKAQIAAMNAKGMTVEEISKATGVNYTDVEVFLQTRSIPMTKEEPEQLPRKRGRGQRISKQTKQAIIEWFQQGNSVAATARKFGVDPKTVRNVLNSETEKEPASAATDTSPVIEDDNINSLCNKSTTPEKKSQELSGISGLSLLECALDEWLGIGQEAEIVSVRADQEDCELVFAYKKEKYIMTFGRYEE
ncbi:MAG: helix-turn-helix domain-containing protein [Ruminococcus sp.]|nr:helix-turn-helix domain-containing protein [Ruminococcus sp.]